MKRFRFSLLSLLVGVVLAGGVLWLNVRPNKTQSEIVFVNMDGTREFDTFSKSCSGWPWAYYSSDSLFGAYWLWPFLAANIAIGLAIVFGCAGVCEWLVRRRAKAKE